MIAGGALNMPSLGRGLAVGPLLLGWLLSATLTASAARPAAAVTPQVSSYQVPSQLPLHVLNPFHPPARAYGAGHLGVDLALPAGASVLAADAGVVSFAGQVAGRGVVVLSHPDGISTEYEPVAVLVRAGQKVGRGAVIGVLSGAHAGCEQSCLHWGARRGQLYLDPLGLLVPLGPVRLVPCQARGWAC